MAVCAQHMMAAAGIVLPTRCIGCLALAFAHIFTKSPCLPTATLCWQYTFMGTGNDPPTSIRS